MEHLANLDTPDNTLQAAMDVVPRSVIIWATPYKQLHKDPGLLISVDGQARPIDELRSESVIKGTAFEPLHRRVMEAMDDVEGKYAGLWKLYVFVSDGLFYTGLLARLAPMRCAAEVSPGVEHPHGRHLEAAQRLLITAFQTAYHAWVTTRSLDQRMPIAAFRMLLKLFAANHAQGLDADPEFQKRYSAVDVSYYLHCDATASCRDVRYKFDAAVTQRWLDKDSRRGELAQALRESGHDPMGFKIEQFNDLLHRFLSYEARGSGQNGLPFRGWWKNELPLLGAESDVSPGQHRTVESRERARTSDTAIAPTVGMLKFGEVRVVLESYVQRNVKAGEQNKVWSYVRGRIGDLRSRDVNENNRVPARLLQFQMAPEADEELPGLNRFEANVIIERLGSQVFGEQSTP